MASKGTRPASLSLDLDNEWCFMQTSGDPAWKDLPTYLPAVVPTMLDFFQALNLEITFFIVGKDAEREENAESLRAIGRAGHDIGCHSHGHQPWLHEYSVDEIDQELEMAELAIKGATGVLPRAFRGPGYSYSRDVLEVLCGRGYRVDCSSFPNSTAALSRLYLFAKKPLKSRDRDQRGQLFGRNSEVFRPLKPYEWNLRAGKLLEIPVTTMPFARIPFHFSYILYIAQYSEKLAITYFATALRICAATGVQPSLLFHPLDFLGADNSPASVAFFPGMGQESPKKIRIIEQCLIALQRHFRPVTIEEHVAAIRSQSRLRVLEF